MFDLPKKLTQFKYFVAFFSLSIYASYGISEPISIHLKWYHKFQFAGYYAALEQGYFEEEGLEVTLIEGGPLNNHLHQLINNSSQYAILGSESINSLALGSPVIIVASIFQHAPEVLMTRKSDKVINIRQLKDKVLMLAEPNIAGQIDAMLTKNGLNSANYTKYPYDGDVNKLVDKTVFAMYGYISNEPYQLLQKGVKVDIFSPQDYGIDFYGDSLATTQSELNNHPDRVASVRRAVIRGWNYAIKHPDELIEHILSMPTANPMPFNQVHQRYEANKTIDLIDSKNIPLGYSSPDRWAAMFDTFNEVTNGQAIFSQDAIYDEFYQDRTWVRHTIIGAISAFILIILLYIWNRTLKSKLDFAMQKLEKEAFEDTLTGMKNRSAMMLYFEECRTKEKHNYYLAIIDIAKLQKINKSQGFQIADNLIRRVANIINQYADKQSQCYSLYGGKFAFITSAKTHADFKQNTDRLIGIIQSSISNINLRSGGIKLDFNLDNSALATRFEQALQHAKGLKSNKLVFFSNTIVEAIEARENLLTMVKKGIERKEFVAFYQPKVCSKSGKIKGLEALVRWQHPQRGLLRPGEFLPVVETSKELMLELENNIFDTVISEAPSLIKHFNNAPGFRISINLSSNQFNRDFLAKELSSICNSYQVNSKFIEFELTESSMLEDLDCAILISNQLQAAGFHVSLDDFGTGYSSLAYLQNLPVNVVKLDYTFVKKIPHDIRSGYVVEHIILLAHKLGLTIVAEGVEQKEQLDYLKNLKVELIQGFYFYKPMPLSDILQIQSTQVFHH